MNHNYRIPLNLCLILIAVLLASACAQPPVTKSPAVEPQSEQPASSATDEITSAAEITPTATPEADPRDQLGSSVWGAVFDDGTETWYQFENDQAKSEVRDGKLVLTAKKANSFDA